MKLKPMYRGNQIIAVNGHAVKFNLAGELANESELPDWVLKDATLNSYCETETKVVNAPVQAVTTENQVIPVQTTLPVTTLEATTTLPVTTVAVTTIEVTTTVPVTTEEVLNEENSEEVTVEEDVTDDKGEVTHVSKKTRQKKGK